jgi:hypothetical protein
MPRPDHRVQLCMDIARVRSELGKLRRQLPKAPGTRSCDPHDMAAAFRLEQAIRHCVYAEQSWDDPEPEDA